MKHVVLIVLIVLMTALVWKFAFASRPEPKPSQKESAAKPQEPPKPKFKELVELYPGGEPRPKSFVYADRPALKSGLCTEFYKSGKLKCETKFLEGLAAGSVKFY